MNRREFLQTTAAGAMFCAGAPPIWAAISDAQTTLVSPGCRGSKVKVARLYMGNPEGLWPKPHLDFQAEKRFYETKFAEMHDDFADVEFVCDEILTDPAQVQAIQEQLQNVDGILVIHLSLSVMPILREILSANVPTMVFAVPYSGHDWVGFGQLQKEPLGAKMDCLLTSDYKQLATAIRPFRATHHLREAKIINLSARESGEYAQQVQEKWGTVIQNISLDRVMAAYNAINEKDARQEADRWIREAVAVVEPSKDEINKSCRLALAFERILAEEKASVMTVDCYGTMWRKLPAYPCIGFTRLNNMGLGGICESDLRSAMTHILFQGLSGRPGFISDPTMDESDNSIILAHCLGTNKMDGPKGPGAPYKIRSIMERQEGAVPQVTMRIGQKVTQAILVGIDSILYFTGEIVAAPDTDRGCRTKIKVRVDGDATRLWKNWTQGLHRQTCYGDLSKELTYFSRFHDMQLVNEAV